MTSMKLRGGKERKILLAEFGMICVALFWGMGFVAGKFVLEDMGPFDLMGYRYGLAFLTMLILSVRHYKFMTKKTLYSGALIGVLMFIGNMVQTYGLQFTTPGKQTFIICTYTVIIPLLSWIVFREKIPANMIAAAAIAFVGIALLTLQDDFSVNFGDALTFVFALVFSIQVIIIGSLAGELDPFMFALSQMGTCAVFSVTASFLFGEGLSIGALTSLSFSASLGMIELVFFNTAFAFVVQTVCQRIVPAHHIAILMSTETVFGTFFAVTLAGEVFTGRMTVGCVLMFISLIVSNLRFDGTKTACTEEEG